MTTQGARHYLICWLPAGENATPDLFEDAGDRRPLLDRHLRLLAHTSWPDGKELWARRVEDQSILTPAQVRSVSPI